MEKSEVLCPRCITRMRLELVMVASDCVSAAFHCAVCEYTLTENFMMSRKEALAQRFAFERQLAALRQYATHLGNSYSESDGDL